MVPAGDGWDNGAFNPAIIDGRLYGRGAIDDKGPMVAALFAMKVLKDMGFNPGKLIRLIIGLDEEVEWRGMDRYFETERKPGSEPFPCTTSILRASRPSRQKPWQ